MSSADEFGHFRLPLTLNKGNIDMKAAERLFTKTNGKLGRFTESRPEHYASWNLLGMLAFRLGKFEEALQYLDKVLSPNEDPDNLNALANRKYICEKLYRLTEARDCEQKIARLLGEGVTEEGKRRLRKLRARSFFEQAFALTNEIYGFMATDRYRKAFALHQAAIELAGKDVAQSERAAWIFESGLACKSIYGRIKWDKSKKVEVKKFYQGAVNNFITIIQFNEDEDRKIKAWRRLGDLFYHSRDLLPPIPETYREFVDEPDKCFEKALSLSPNNPKVLTRRATHFIKKDQTKALSLLDRAIELGDSEFNLQVRYDRANIYLSQYKQQLKYSQKSRDPMAQCPDDTLLTRAKEDLSFAIKDVSKPWFTELMAEVLYYLATDCYGRLRYGSERLLQQALTYCAKAVEIADGSKRGNVHKVRGMCLCVMGEHQAAFGSYKRAVECEIAASYHGGSVGALVLEYKHILPDNHLALREDLPLLADMVYWLQKVAEVCLSTDWDLWQLNKLKQMRDHWEIFVKYCKDNDYEKELEVIESAAIDKRRSSRLQHPLSSPHDSDVPPTSEQGQNRSFPSASNVGDAASSFCDASSLSHDIQYKRQTRAKRQLSLPVSVEDGSLPPSVTRRQHSLPASSRYVQPTSRAQGEELSDRTGDNINAEYLRESQGASAAPARPIPDKIDRDIQTLSESLSQVDLDGNEEHHIPPDTIHITYSVNLKTGKTQHVATMPSLEEPPTEVVSKKNVREALERPQNNLTRKYDFFVIYSSSASEWVQHRMLEELEESGFKGCIKDRDFELGKPRLQNYSDSIEDSVCVIIVITADFETNNNDVRGMLMALDSDRLVVPVLYEDRVMPLVLKTLEHLDATGAVDWPRLARCIEQQVKL
ncbi:uncharacterized protein LOC119720303 [Patiria miniata]|uniref:TIR domain-containing protein n=1 Tax=Patiria miniata TaxID=46514 RepID=A0A913Z2E3_PATMI|nr:uncharacterized protein LOC119720303 [Patiria miniata]